jgi:hypothetical protein
VTSRGLGLPRLIIYMVKVAYPWLLTRQLTMSFRPQRSGEPWFDRLTTLSKVEGESRKDLAITGFPLLRE